ncbi:putative quinol monooxygenase [Streptomyces sp. JJ38]|uniref:putative quinol monooxygenase n=1 Tax=Streptomyces sp. JJ38 TaxID=2738128 RepID=UPI001C590481|nr:putative quinol monooxygenase [Streptomyces sp. JJ38]
MYHIAVSFDVPEERRADFVAAALADGRDSAADEPGTLRFELIADSERPGRFYLNEAYEDERAFDLHCEGPHFARFFELIKDYAEGPTWLIKGNRIEDEQTATAAPTAPTPEEAAR